MNTGSCGTTDSSAASIFSDANAEGQEIEQTKFLYVEKAFGGAICEDASEYLLGVEALALK